MRSFVYVCVCVFVFTFTVGKYKATYCSRFEEWLPLITNDDDDDDEMPTSSTIRVDNNGEDFLRWTRHAKKTTAQGNTGVSANHRLTSMHTIHREWTERARETAHINILK